MVRIASDFFPGRSGARSSAISFNAFSVPRVHSLLMILCYINKDKLKDLI
jgi:hypothetical protein